MLENVVVTDLLTKRRTASEAVQLLGFAELTLQHFVKFKVGSEQGIAQDREGMTKW